MNRRVLKVDGENSVLRQIVEQLILDVQNLQRARLPATPAAIEALLKAIHGISGDETFSAKICLENCQGDEENSVRLAEAIQRVIRKPINRALDTPPSKSSVVSLARILTRSCGVFGPWQLMLHRAHTNAGSTFRIVTHT